MERSGEFYRRFGQNLRQARRAAGLSQSDLAVAIKLTRTSISNIEKGRQKVLLHTFGEMLHVLSVQPSDLLPDTSTRFVPRPPGLNSLAHDEQDFVNRGLGRLAEEEHGSSLDTNSEDNKGFTGGV